MPCVGFSCRGSPAICCSAYSAGPYLGNLINEPMANQLQVITGIATTLIALIAGLSLNFERLGRRLTSIAYMTVTTLVVAMLGLIAFAWIAWPWLGLAPEATGLQRLAMILPLVTIIISFSPTMTAAVMAETGARGRLSELVLTMVLVADLVLLVLFSLAMQVARVVFGTESADVSAVARFAWEIGGATAFGALVGAMFALYVRYVGREVTLVLLAVCALLSQVGTTQNFEPLLAAMTAGLVIENLSPPQGDALRAAVQRGAPPILLIFFVAVGASLRLDALALVGAAAIALSVFRLAMIRLGILAGLRVSGISRDPANYAWTGLISQAGITLGFGSIVAAEFPEWGANVQTLLVALIAIHELVGPIVFRHGLARAGEIDATAPRPLMVVSNREPYLHNHDGDGAHRRIAGNRRRRGGARRADAGAWRRVDCARRRICRPCGRRRLRQSAGPARRTLRTSCAGSGLTNRRSRRTTADSANEGLWPLCHMVDVRPQFRSEDWAAYQDVNVRFAAAIDEELGTPTTPIFIQDYHLALVAPALARASPRCQDGAVLAHPVALSGSPSHLSMAAGDPGRAACQRPARVPAGTRSTEFPARGGGRAWRRNRDRSVERAAERTSHDGRFRADRR